jgi:hypothetical protein
VSASLSFGLAAPCKFSTELFYERASRGQIRKTPPKIDLFFYDNSPPVPHLNFPRPVKLRHSAVYFEIQYIIGDGKLDDVGIFASFSTAFPLSGWRTITGLVFTCG